MNRSKVSITDYQRIKLLELDEQTDDVSRMPRTFDVEVRTRNLVNQCIPGDIVVVTGIVKTIQTEAPRAVKWNGKESNAAYRESGIHQLYLLANSVICLQSSGEKGGKEDPALLGSNKKQRILDSTIRKQPAPGIPSAMPGAGGYSNHELAFIRNLALSENCFAQLVHSFCPTIYGHELVKAGLLLGLFGGTQQKHFENQCESDGVHVRSDIHVLVVGDPGLGKSQMLRAAANIAPRAVFVCGNTSTTAGLTVTIGRESSRNGGDVTIEAGALVLADQGVCCIDELDKISCDQHALLEAMEQQSISIAKSGVVTSLKSRTAIFAAANPAGGHYNRKKTVSENLKMNSALLSRFDLIFILLDRPDEQRDRMISEHIMKTHHLAESRPVTGMSSRPSSSVGGTSSSQRRTQQMESTLTQRLRHQVAEIDMQSAASIPSVLRPSTQQGGAAQVTSALLRKYIEYARQYVHPVLTRPAAKVLQRLYLTMRSEASLGKSIPVTTRHLECLIRLAQARAKVELREEVTEDDANDVVQLLQESLLDTFTNEVGEIDLSRKGGISLAKQVKALIKVMTHESGARGSNMFSRNEMQELCFRLKLDKDVDSIIEVMRTECYLLLKGPRLYQLQTV